MQDADQSASTNSIVAAVKSLLGRKHIPPRQQSKKLAEILDLSYSQAHRKLSSDEGWTIAQLQVVAHFFGESLGTIGLGEVDAVADGHAIGMKVEGVFAVAEGKYEYPCVLWMGEQIQTMRRLGFVAYEEAGTWKVVERPQCPAGVAGFKVNKLEIILNQPEVLDIAIAGDDVGSLAAVRDFLEQNGLQITAFRARNALEEAIRGGRSFDGYVFDWLLGQRKTEELIKSIRTSPGGNVPIFILTDDMSSTPEDQDELARVILQFSVQVREKPLRLRTFTAEFLKALGI